MSAICVATLTQGPKAADMPSFRTELLESVLKPTSYSSGIERKQIVEGIDVWLSSYRHGHTDNDGIKVTFSGYAFKISNIIEYARRLSKAGTKAAVSIVSLKSDLYSGIPVYRFELAVVENQETLLPAHGWAIFDLIDKAVTSSNGRISRIKTAPLIKVQDKFGLPVELSVENLVTDEWNAVKQKLSELKGDRISLSGTSDRGMTDGGFTLRMKVLIEP